MAPLILHNVPDEELYVGDDGIQRPYAMIFPQQNGHVGSVRGRRTVTETGSFGKSTRRSRSKTGTPARREDPTVAAADKVFNKWFEDQSRPSSTTTSPQRKSGCLMPSSQSQPNLLSQSSSAAGGLDDASGAAQAHLDAKEPTEVILRGYRSSQQQYAAINHYETIAGRICEDYPRDPPLENRRYKSELRDPAYTRWRALTPEERVLVNRADGGEHWVKVTFESAAAAENAVYASPQSVLGYLVWCEPYRGMAPLRDEPDPDPSNVAGAAPPAHARHHSSEFGTARRRGRAGTLPKAYSSPAADAGQGGLSPPLSQSSSQTLDTGTLTTNTSTDTTTASSATVTGGALATGRDSVPRADDPFSDPDGIYCRVIPSARKLKLLPAEQALLPQLSVTQRVVNRIPFLKWFSGSMIGNEVPRTDTGDFDWDKASLYWKIIWWFDHAFGLFGGEILNADKDD